MTVITPHRVAPADAPDGAPLRWGNILWVALVAVAVAAASFAAGARQRSTTPGDGSAEAGFARDMAVHHAQAVEMGEAIRFRTADPALRTLATDIVLTQQAQIGQMTGWLESWGLPATGRQPTMAWMGDRMAGAMPGMATEAERTAISQEPLAEAEIIFLQAMIRHHRGGVTMAEGLLGRSRHRVVRRLAEKIRAAQESEIRAMTDLLSARGAAPGGSAPSRHDAGGGSHGS